jgi:ribosome-associated heat shock protein Hsp15
LLTERLYLFAMQAPERVRIDKWLWAVRLYKSRSLAAVACNAGHIKIGGQSVKASREVHVGEVISALAGRVNRTVKVVALLENRVGAKVVSKFLEDQTPPEEYARAREEAAQAAVHFPKGLGRPTKKQRRLLLGVLDRLE